MGHNYYVGLLQVVFIFKYTYPRNDNIADPKDYNTKLKYIKIKIKK